jgi:alpha-amylase
MNWDDLEAGGVTAEVLEHWRRLGRFRRDHPAVGAGVHRTLQAVPYIFSRTLEQRGRSDRVLVAMDQRTGAKSIPVFEVFPEGTELMDGYSGVTGRVRNKMVSVTSEFELVLLARRP